MFREKRNRRLSVSTLLLLLVLTLPAGGDSEENEKQFQKAMREGIASARSGPLPRALARFKTAVMLKPRSAEARYRLALTYNDRKMYDSAEKEAQKAVALDEKHAGAWLVRGSALFYQDLEEEAIKALNKAFRLEPKNAHASYMLGRCYYFLGAREKQKAAELYRNARHATEDEAGDLAVKTRNLEDKAQQILRKALQYFYQTLKLHSDS